MNFDNILTYFHLDADLLKGGRHQPINVGSYQSHYRPNQGRLSASIYANEKGQLRIEMQLSKIDVPVQVNG